MNYNKGMLTVFVVFRVCRVHLPVVRRSSGHMMCMTILITAETAAVSLLFSLYRSPVQVAANSILFCSGYRTEFFPPS